jgi:hypothetical protein
MRSTDSQKVDALAVVSRFAKALDAEDYDAARLLLASACAYETASGTLAGPDAILQSYREAGAAARRKLDAVEFSSSVAAVTPSEAVITFTDRIVCRGEGHEYRCAQRAWVTAQGLIDRIRHEELPGQREALQAFFARHGVTT